MQDRIYRFLQKAAWVILFISIAVNLFNWIEQSRSELCSRSLPFNIRNSRIVNVKDSTLTFLTGMIIIKIDSIQVQEHTDLNLRGRKHDRNGSIFYSPGLETDESLEKRIIAYCCSRDRVSIEYEDPTTGKGSSLSVGTVLQFDKSTLLSLIFNIVLITLIFFNVFLLLKYSVTKINIYIIFFMLLLTCPDNLTEGLAADLLMNCIAGLFGILFYIFIHRKVYPNLKTSGYLYANLALILLVIAVKLFLATDLIVVLYGWSLFWMLLSLIVLRKGYRQHESIELKRLLNAFRGLFLSIIAVIMLLITNAIFELTTAGFAISGMYNLQMTLLSLILIAAAMTFLVGVFWFFGSFTWGMLTGTVLDVKIRSTIIYTIIGIVFITFFGLIDYSLGELLQGLFGNFIGSDFIAGIPATIGLLAFFNPVRAKVEQLVDNKLNTSDLDFLEKTDSFTEDLSGESVIEGFEEYICENLMRKLPIKKVALISYDKEQNDFKFNEIRGSEIEENSLVRDVHKILTQQEIFKTCIVNEDPREISSFNLVIPIIHDPDCKWFLALGSKQDGTVYTRNDEKSLVKLASKIKLSLKFILAYDNIVNNRYIYQLQQKDKLISHYEELVKNLKAEKENLENDS
ncbi:MAG: hypothetical protein JW996_01555 [Candidatus Cloacimonetes bacterium]|nr:hypothetical protein [Candidatus Cloacimonadota bacterium]